MEKRHKKLLLLKRLELIKDIEVNNITGYLFQEEVITENNKEQIESKTTRRERAEFFLDLLPKKGPSAFNKFCKVLRDSDIYGHLADLLQNDLSNRNEVTDACDGPSIKSTSNLEMRPRSSSKLEQDMLNFYDVSSESRGWCFILNNSEFETLPDRNGSNKDAENLQSLFKILGFQIWTVSNADAKTVKEKFEELANKTDHTDCLVVCLLSHGINGNIYGTDGNLVSVGELLQIISHGPLADLLQGKPKLFIIQACRINENEGKYITKEKKQIHSSESVANSNAKSSELNIFSSFVNQNHVQMQQHLLLGYSTFPGEVSWRNTKYGSYYIDSLVNVFLNFAKSEDVLSMLVKVNELVGEKLISHGITQTPSPVFTTTKKLYLFPIEVD